MCTEKEKMLAGQPYKASEEGLVQGLLSAKEMSAG